MTTSRNIILLSDGTGNARGKLEQTNVWRTYEAIDLKDGPRPELPRQFAYYDDGVGTESFKPLAILGGALGYGLARNVRDLYEFLCRTYRDGDKVYAFGFSRGAFTIRVLLGLINNQGLVSYRGDEAELRRMSNAALRAYRRERYRLLINWIAIPRALRDGAVAAWGKWRAHRPYVKADNRMVNTEFVGLWDTVAAYGMPVDEMATFINAMVWPLDMPDRQLNKRVKRAAHALAIDDERYTFHPKLWDPDVRIKQVWFAGMHSDVGGGYADKGLAHVSLQWVLAEAASAGLRFTPSICRIQRALADENGPMNDSRRGLAGYYRYKPRELPPGSIVHQSVLRRIAVGQDAYAPIVLPHDFKVMGFDGVVRPPNDLIGPFDAAGYRDARERVLNRVWLRRTVYFMTVVATVGLLSLPVFRSEDGQACTTSGCWLSPAIRALKVVLPAPLEGWATWYAANPGLLLFLGLTTWALLSWGGSVQRSVFDRMRKVWYSLPKLRPSSLLVEPAAMPAGSFLGRMLTRVRHAKAYTKLVAAMRRVVVPTLLGVGSTAVTLMLIASLWFAVKAADGDFCVGSGRLLPVSATLAPRTFANRDACAATGIELQAGGTYDLTLTVDVPTLWMDGALAADWQGVAVPSLWHTLAALMKRELTQPVFTPMARIGRQGADLHVLEADPSQPKVGDHRVRRSRIVARTSGELFLYVNDVVGPPWNPLLYYQNNQGTASFQVRQVVAHTERSVHAP